MNEKRRDLRRPFRLAASDDMDVVLIAFKDRLERFGFAHIVAALGAYGVRVEVLDGAVATEAGQ